MSNRPIFQHTATLTNAAESAANTETVVATISGISTQFGGQTIKLNAWCKITVGTTATGAIVRLRRNSLTGTSIADATAETGQVGASKTTEFEIATDDTPGDVAGMVYVLTFTGAGEGTAATFLAADIEARVD